MHRWIPLCLLVVASIAPGMKGDETPPGIVYDTAADESQWGNLQLRFVYDGVAPEPKKITLRGGAVIDSEQLVINKKDSGLANVVVWLRRDPKEKKALRVHPSYAESQAGDVPLAIEGEAFIPHVTIVRTTQNLIISNIDLQGHNVTAPLFYNQPFNRLVQPGATTRLDFPLAEHIPSRLDDLINPGVMGYLAVFDHPYAAVSDKSGQLKFEKLPIGKWTFVVWHESAGYIKQATLAGKTVKWERGRATLDIKAGGNDLGEVKVAPEQFKR
jgi:hypothetical protein